MRVLLDCRFQRGAGPNVATRYLLDALVNLNSEHEFIILQHHQQPLPDYPRIKKFFVPTRNPLFEFFWVQMYLPMLIKKHKIDLCHSLKHVGPLYAGIPTILHVHEAGHFDPMGQEAFQLKFLNKIYWNYVLRWGMTRANHIIGVSGEIKSVMVHKLGIPKNKVSVVHYGIDPKFQIIEDAADIENCIKRYKLPKYYILCVSNFYPHKNVDTVVKMYSKLRERIKDPPFLVLVGDRSYASQEFMNFIGKTNLDESIIFPGYVEHDDLVYIYNQARLFVFPPVVVGFGIPPLEAMACGIPVVASSYGALPEVTGGAALLLENPKNVEQMLNAVCRLLDDEQLRKELQHRGLERAKQFSWEASASKLLKLYQFVGQGEDWKENVVLGAQ